MAKLSVDQALAQAKSHVKNGQISEAKVLYATVLKSFPNNKKARQGLDSLKVRRFSGAGNQIPETIINQLMALVKNERFDVTIQQTKNLITYYKRDVALWNILGIASAQLRLFDQAVSAFEQVINLAPSEASAHFNLGNVLKDRGNLADAIERYTRALELKPDYEAAFKNLNLVLGSQDQYPNDSQKIVTDVYKKTRVINLELANSLFENATKMQGQGRIDQAISEYKKAIEKWPTFAEAYYNMGVAFADQGKFKDAVRAYEEAVCLKTDYFDAYNNMGIALSNLGKIDEAISAYRVAIELAPGYSDAHNNMGNAYKAIGKIKDAIVAYYKALCIEPDHAEANENISILQVQIYGRLGAVVEDLNDFNTNLEPNKKNCPTGYILNAIDAFMSNDMNNVTKQIQNFNSCKKEQIANLSPGDRQFCDAYSEYLAKLILEQAELPAMMTLNNSVYHLGESHCLSYAHHKIMVNAKEFNIVPVITFGAKAFHFCGTKENDFKAITKINLSTIPKASRVFISFGEIDCRPNEGFIVAASKLTRSIDKLISDTVDGFLNWFASQNKVLGHQMHFLNVPAPVYNEQISQSLNSEVCKIVKLFNEQLSKQVAHHDFTIIDVYSCTLGSDGFSNGTYHIDSHHLSSATLQQIEPQLKK